MNMLELIKQGLFSSIGLASLTQEKVSEIVSEVGKHIPLTEQQAKEFANEMNERSEQAKKTFGEQFDKQVDHAFIQMGLVKNEIRKATESASDAFNRAVEDQVRAALEKMGAASVEEVEALKKRVAILESKLEQVS
ncbi:MAG: phasin family protein [Planctomycetes bacterium]|jgi:polyhydroxyalkanoate synthesis regulator phasin|nr:phasin family protein [Planctomycetota bacterium]